MDIQGYRIVRKGRLTVKMISMVKGREREDFPLRP